MRGGLVALGIVFMFLGVAWFIPVMFGSAFGLGGALAGFCAWIVLAPVFLILGFVLFLVGLVAEPEDRVLLPAPYPVYYPPPPPQVVYVQAPPTQERPPGNPPPPSP